MKSVNNILVLTTWGYKDGLIQSSTLPYLKMIHQVVPQAKIFLQTQEKEDGNFDEKQKCRINEELGLFNIIWIPQQYHRFGIRKILASVYQFVELFWILLTKNISHIHAFCTPAGSVAYFLSLFTGKKLVIDSYEPHAESMVENGTWKNSGLAFKMLWWLEKKQSEKASYCIAAASGMPVYAAEKYGVKLTHHGVRPACVDLERFEFHKEAAERFRKEWDWTDKVVCVYAGKLGGIYLDKEVFDFFRTAHEFWGDKFRVLLLTAHTEDEVYEYCSSSGLPHYLVRRVTAPFQQMPEYLSVADFAITPVKPVPSKRFCTPIKDGEYWAIGLPVVIPDNISDDSDIIRNNNAGAVLKQLTKAEYKNAILKIDQLLNQERNALRQRIRALAETYRNYNIAENEYKKIYGMSYC